MKPHPCFPAFILLIAYMLVLPVSTVQASPQSSSVPNPAAETYVLNELRSTGYANLEFLPEEERVIGGTFLINALKDPEVRSQPVISITNGTIAGDLLANDLVIPFNIFFTNMEFDGFVSFSGAQLQSITIYNSNFHKSLNFMRTTFDGNADLRKNVIQESVNFSGAHVSGELWFDETEILGTEKLDGTTIPVEFAYMTVGGLASFAATTFQGDASFGRSSFQRLEMTATFNGIAVFVETRVEETADFSSAQFASRALFENFNTGSDANFDVAWFNAEADFKNASIGRDAKFTSAEFNGEAIFDYFKAERFVDFTNTIFHQSFRFHSTTVSHLHFEYTVFNGPVALEGMRASQAVELVNTSYVYTEEPFRFTLVDMHGAVSFTGFTAPAGILLSDGNFGSLRISANENPEIAFIDMTGTDIDSNLIIENVNIKSFLAEGLSVGESTTLSHVSVREKLDMRNANIGILKLEDQLEWPVDPQSFNLRGLTYSDIDLGDQGFTEESWQRLLQLVNGSAYSRQAYQSLSQLLTDKGHPDWAAEVTLAQKRRERDEILMPLSGSWFWSWFLDIFDGYGYHPAFAFIWSGLVIVIGAFIFRRKEDMLPVEQEDVQVEYNPIWYSFALFLPYIDLGIARKWEPSPERKWARNYKYVHMILGWALTLITLLSFSGIFG